MRVALDAGLTIKFAKVGVSYECRVFKSGNLAGEGDSGSLYKKSVRTSLERAIEGALDNNKKGESNAKR